MFLHNKDLQVPLFKRLFLTPVFFIDRFDEVDSYVDGNPNFSNERAGSNDSDEDNFISSTAEDISIKLWFNLLLPIGSGKENIIAERVLDEGILESGATGGETWNPFRSGRTYIKIAPFYREKDFIDADVPLDEDLLRTSGIEFQLFYDNTDLYSNPSRGSAQSVAYKNDFGELNSTVSWASWEFEYEKYFSLGATPKARQRVIAFDFWTTDVITWNRFDTDSSGNRTFQRPPLFEGATLGGLWKLRGYPASRFYDRSAIYYGLEYRHIPTWNPLKNFTVGGRLDWDWVQFVGFGEVGRVAPSWTLDDLHSSMKWTIGAGIRAMVNKLIIRIDGGVSSETVQFQLFINQPFGF